MQTVLRFPARQSYDGLILTFFPGRGPTWPETGTLPSASACPFVTSRIGRKKNGATTPPSWGSDRQSTYPGLYHNLNWNPHPLHHRVSPAIHLPYPRIETARLSCPPLTGDGTKLIIPFWNPPSTRVWGEQINYLFLGPYLTSTVIINRYALHT